MAVDLNESIGGCCAILISFSSDKYHRQTRGLHPLWPEQLYPELH